MTMTWKKINNEKKINNTKQITKHYLISSSRTNNNCGWSQVFQKITPILLFM